MSEMLAPTRTPSGERDRRESSWTTRLHTRSRRLLNEIPATSPPELRPQLQLATPGSMPCCSKVVVPQCRQITVESENCTSVRQGVESASRSLEALLNSLASPPTTTSSLKRELLFGVADASAGALSKLLPEIEASHFSPIHQLARNAAAEARQAAAGARRSATTSIKREVPDLWDAEAAHDACCVVRNSIARSRLLHAWTRCIEYLRHIDQSCKLQARTFLLRCHLVRMQLQRAYFTWHEELMTRASSRLLRPLYVYAGRLAQAALRAPLCRWRRAAIACARRCLACSEAASRWAGGIRVAFCTLQLVARCRQCALVARHAALAATVRSACLRVFVTWVHAADRCAVKSARLRGYHRHQLAARRRHGWTTWTSYAEARALSVIRRRRSTTRVRQLVLVYALSTWQRHAFATAVGRVATLRLRLQLAARAFTEWQRMLVASVAALAAINRLVTSWYVLTKRAAMRKWQCASVEDSSEQLMLRGAVLACRRRLRMAAWHWWSDMTRRTAALRAYLSRSSHAATEAAFRSWCMFARARCTLVRAEGRARSTFARRSTSVVLTHWSQLAHSRGHHLLVIEQVVSSLLHRRLALAWRSLATRTAAFASALNALEVALRRLCHARLHVAWQSWAEVVETAATQRALFARCIGRLQNRALGSAWFAWREAIADDERVLGTLHARVLLRMVHGAMARAWGQIHAVTAAEARVLQRTRQVVHALANHQQANAWHTWCEAAAARQGAMMTARQCTQLLLCGHMSRAWRSWQSLVSARDAALATLVIVLRRLCHIRLNAGWQSWAETVVFGTAQRMQLARCIEQLRNHALRSAYVTWTAVVATRANVLRTLRRAVAALSSRWLATRWATWRAVHAYRALRLRELRAGICARRMHQAFARGLDAWKWSIRNTRCLRLAYSRSFNGRLLRGWRRMVRHTLLRQVDCTRLQLLLERPTGIRHRVLRSWLRRFAVAVAARPRKRHRLPAILPQPATTGLRIASPPPLEHKWSVPQPVGEWCVVAASWLRLDELLGQHAPRLHEIPKKPSYQ